MFAIMLRYACIEGSGDYNSDEVKMFIVCLRLHEPRRLVLSKSSCAKITVHIAISEEASAATRAGEKSVSVVKGSGVGVLP